MESWLQDNNIEMCSTHNEGKSVAAKRFIRTLKTKIYKYMMSISKNVYIDKLDELVNNTTIHIIKLLKWSLLILKVTSATKQTLLKMCHLRHKFRIFLFCRKVMFCSQNIQVFVDLAIQRFRKPVMAWWVLVHETGCIFEYIFWTSTHEPRKLGELIDICKGNNFQKSFGQIGIWG